MAGDYYPRTQPAIPPWTKNFGEGLLSSEGRFGVDVETAEAYMVLQQTFVAEYQLVSAPITNSSSQRCAMHQARKALERESRRLAQMIKDLRIATAQDLYALGLNPEYGGGRRPRVSAPRSAPFLYIVKVLGRRITLRLRNNEQPDRRGRLKRSKGAGIFYFVGSQPPVSRSEWKNAADTIRTRYTLELGADVPAGAAVWITAAWKSPTFEQGPMASPVCAHIGAGVTTKRTLARAA